MFRLYPIGRGTERKHFTHCENYATTVYLIVMGKLWFRIGKRGEHRFSLAGHPPFVVNRYLIAKGTDRKLVLYWYWAHGRAVASEYWAKIYLVTDAIRMNRSDGSLVRLTTPMAPDETAEVAMQRLLPFVQDIVPLLNQYIPQ